MSRTLKLLLLILISSFLNLINPQIDKADQQIQFVSRVSIYKGQWNNLTPLNGIRHYTVKNIPQAFQVLIQITNFDPAQASVSLNSLYCSTDPTVFDFDTASNTGKFTNVSFSSNGVTSTSALITLAGGSVFNSGTTITTPTLPCSSITFEFANATQVATNVEIVASFTTLVLNQTGLNGGIGSSSATGGGNVQGVQATGTNGTPILPIADGGLAPAINSGLNNNGVDSFSTASTPVPASQSTFVVSQNPPTPSVVGEYALVAIADSNFAVSQTENYPCLTGGSCLTSNDPQFAAKTLSTVPAQNTYTTTYTTTSAGCTPGLCNQFVTFVVFKTTPTSTRNGSAGNVTTGISLGVNSLAGSNLVVAVDCSTITCTIAPTDTQGLTWRNINVVVQAGNSGTQSMATWVSSPTTAAADTVTYNVVSGTIQGGAIVELVGLAPASLNQPLTPLSVRSDGALVTSPDAVSSTYFAQTVTLSTNTTTQIIAAPASGRIYITDIQINTTTAGTATTIQLKNGTGANCGTGTANLSAIAYPNTTVAITSILGVRTPLVSPAVSAVCATQAGTTAGTSVIEVRGFFAP